MGHKQVSPIHLKYEIMEQMYRGSQTSSSFQHIGQTYNPNQRLPKKKEAMQQAIVINFTQTVSASWFGPTKS